MPFGKKQIAKSQETIQIHFLCIFLFCACSSFLFSLLCAVWHSKRMYESLRIAPPPHVRVTFKYIFMYFRPYCVPASLFIFFTSCRLAKKTRSQNRRRRSKSIFFVFSYFVPSVLAFVIFFFAKRHEVRKIKRLAGTQ